ncbi:MAG: formylglycine-generating enzyme family protein [Campylobacteraceae bacterium]|jgi:formylglycine-generating enzyme required for sulfatase activity|nr:formylglycine-generating enzyme family protein [Campylobacteraceae bacterium]
MSRYFLYLTVILLILSGCSEKKKELSKTYTNSIGMKFALIDAGSFMMGSNEKTNEQPIHNVTISKSFYLGTTEVTQEQWEKVMNDNPSEIKAASNPVDSVSWYDVKLFLSRLNALENTTKYRLPTEAEWEYAASTAADDLEKYAWYYDKNDKTKSIRPQATAQKMPNSRGLYDMYGNVWEWVETFYDKDFYAKNPKVKFVSGGNTNIIKGGSSYNSAEFLRSWVRVSQPSASAANNIGFRTAVTIED